MDLRAGTRCIESHFSVMGGVHSKGRNRLLNSKVKKLTAVVSNTKMLDKVSSKEFASGEEACGEESESDSDYASDTNDENTLEAIEAAAAVDS